MVNLLGELFSDTYAQACERLRAAARALDLTVESNVLDTHKGADGEPLTTDEVAALEQWAVDGTGRR